jgi:hypothetical protein
VGRLAARLTAGRCLIRCLKPSPTKPYVAQSAASDVNSITPHCREIIRRLAGPALASHARGRWFETSRAHSRLPRIRPHFGQTRAVALHGGGFKPLRLSGAARLSLSRESGSCWRYQHVGRFCVAYLTGGRVSRRASVPSCPGTMRCGGFSFSSEAEARAASKRKAGALVRMAGAAPPRSGTFLG